MGERKDGIMFFVDENEKQKIKNNAKANGMTVSSFLRYIALNYEKDKGSEK